MGAPGAAAGLGLAAGIAASKVLADSGVADKAGNELKYMAKLLGRGKLPYTR
jgi:hypothetical protein